MKTSVATLLPLLAPLAAVDAFFLAAPPPPPPGALPRARMMARTTAFPPLGASPASILAAPNDRVDDELSDAIAGVKAAAREFGGGAERFASAWIDRALMAKKDDDGAAELPSGLLEECVIDDGEERCQRFERALKRLDALLGVGAGEQY